MDSLYELLRIMFGPLRFPRTFLYDLLSKVLDFESQCFLYELLRKLFRCSEFPTFPLYHLLRKMFGFSKASASGGFSFVFQSLRSTTAVLAHQRLCEGGGLDGWGSKRIAQHVQRANCAPPAGGLCARL